MKGKVRTPKAKPAPKKNSNPATQWGILVLAGLVVISLLTFYIVKWNNTIADSFLPNNDDFAPFAVPHGYSIHGIDVSRYQQKIQWQKVKQTEVKGGKLEFAIIKATEGTSNTDPYFETNWQKAKQHGLIRGAYHFFVPNEPGQKQAENFLKTVTLQTGDLPAVIDAEHFYGVSLATYRKELMACLKLIQQKTGVVPILYSNVHFYEKYLGVAVNDYKIWLAHYQQQGAPRTRYNWHFWQHTDAGRVKGIRGPVDMNVFNGDYNEFNQLLVP
ncbi:MAG: glycoside hydrolase family 25 protein [Bacteroidetes bacterium]|nr:MAG: glycoside hydrolase family 25 protein [Bacteroidota bacterium]TAF98499.1 MAG: glycoside hydrolase family 25 protein [Bacteroidota bacterium]